MGRWYLVPLLALGLALAGSAAAAAAVPPAAVTAESGCGETAGGCDDAGARNDLRHEVSSEVVCIAGLELMRTYVNGSLADVRATGRSCGVVLGAETPPATGSVIVIIEQRPAGASVLGEQAAPPSFHAPLPAAAARAAAPAAPVTLPSTSTATRGADTGGLAAAGVAAIVAGLALLRRRGVATG